MRFWDASGVVPLCVMEPSSQRVKEILEDDHVMVVWWTTRMECISALVRLNRERLLTATAEGQARTVLMQLAESWAEVQPTQGVRDVTERLLAVHTLRTADALQLAAALIWAGGNPRGHDLVCLDRGLRAAARKEGFTLLPAEV